MPVKKVKFYFSYRSSVTGKYVSKQYGERYPHLVVKERRLRAVLKD